MFLASVHDIRDPRQLFRSDAEYGHGRKLSILPYCH